MHDYLPARVFPPGEVLAYSKYGAALAEAELLQFKSGTQVVQVRKIWIPG